MSNEAMNAIEREMNHLNLAWLYALREIARESAEDAVTRFGIDQEVADLIANASPQDLREMADPAILAFRPRCSGGRLRDYLIGRMSSRAHFVMSSLSSETPDIDTTAEGTPAEHSAAEERLDG